MKYSQSPFFKKVRKIEILLLFCLFTYGCSRAKIIVPNGYIGAVCLIESNVTENELKLDSNGIGYITKDTYEDLEWQPIVTDASGKDLTGNCVGYSPSAFWFQGEFESIEPRMKINYLGFEIVPDSLKGKKQYYDKDFLKVVDKSKLK
jgi:hypothetical protein